jgi:hypothetical protein
VDNSLTLLIIQAGLGHPAAGLPSAAKGDRQACGLTETDDAHSRMWLPCGIYVGSWFRGLAVRMRLRTLSVELSFLKSWRSHKEVVDECQG